MVAARHYGAPLAFCDPEKARHNIPTVDLITVSVKVPDHYRPGEWPRSRPASMSYCEWPLGPRHRRGRADGSRPAETQRGSGMSSDCRARLSPAINYVRDLIADGLCPGGC